MGSGWNQFILISKTWKFFIQWYFDDRTQCLTSHDEILPFYMGRRQLFECSRAEKSINQSVVVYAVKTHLLCKGKILKVEFREMCFDSMFEHVLQSSRDLSEMIYPHFEWTILTNQFFLSPWFRTDFCCIIRTSTVCTLYRHTYSNENMKKIYWSFRKIFIGARLTQYVAGGNFERFVVLFFMSEFCCFIFVFSIKMKKWLPKSEKVIVARPMVYWWNSITFGKIYRKIVPFCAIKENDNNRIMWTKINIIHESNNWIAMKLYLIKFIDWSTFHIIIITEGYSSSVEINRLQIADKWCKCVLDRNICFCFPHFFVWFMFVF